MNNTMKSIRVHSFGGQDTLSYDEVKIPEIAEDEVLVKVKSAAINPVDWKSREGYLVELLQHELPLTLGWDFSGEIEKIGDKVSGYKVGDAVYSRPDIGRNGAYAGYIAVKGIEISAKPKSLNWNEAAAVPLAALTAWQSLYEVAQIEEGDRVLIQAGSGGVGIFAIQLAKLAGAYVYTTCSGANVEFVKSLGADEVIDYTKDDFSKLTELDVVFDTIGGEVQEKSWGTLRKGGCLVSIVSVPHEAVAKSFGVESHFVFVQPNADQLAKLAELLDAEKLSVHIDSVFPFSEVVQAHAKSESHRARGKIILEVST